MNEVTQSAITQLYETKINFFKQKEDKAIKQIFQKDAQLLLEKYSFLKEEDEKQIEQAISNIENSIESLSEGKVIENTANKILEANNLFKNVLDINILNTLKELASGTGFNSSTMEDLERQIIAHPNEISLWIMKIFKTLQNIESIDKSTSTVLTGYLSNLKGAMLEEAVIKILGDKLIDDIAVRTGNIGVKGGRTQIAEDVILLFKNKNTKTLKEYLERAQSEKISIPIEVYSDLQNQSAGISIKAGKGIIKYYQGNLNKFFDNNVSGYAESYRNYLAARDEIKKQYSGDERKIYLKNLGKYQPVDATILNKMLVAAKIENAIGENNLFLVIRGKIFRTSKFLEVKMKDIKRQLRMTDFSFGESGNISGRIIGE